MLLLTPSIRDLLVRRILGIVFFIKEYGHFWIFNFETWGILHIHSHFYLHGLGEYPSGQGLQSPGVSPHPSLTGTSAFSLLEDYSFIETTRRIVFLFFFFLLLFQMHWWTVHVARALESQDPWKMGNSLEKPNALAMPLPRGICQVTNTEGKSGKPRSWADNEWLLAGKRVRLGGAWWRRVETQSHQVKRNFRRDPEGRIHRGDSCVERAALRSWVLSQQQAELGKS